MANFKIRFKEYEVLRDEEGKVISRISVDSWPEIIEASTLEEAFSKAQEKAKAIMEEDDKAEVTYEAEVSPF